MAEVCFTEEFGLDRPLGMFSEIDGTDDDLCGWSVQESGMNGSLRGWAEKQDVVVVLLLDRLGLED